MERDRPEVPSDIETSPTYVRPQERSRVGLVATPDRVEEEPVLKVIEFHRPGHTRVHEPVVVNDVPIAFDQPHGDTHVLHAIKGGAMECAVEFQPLHRGRWAASRDLLHLAGVRTACIDRGLRQARDALGEQHWLDDLSEAVDLVEFLCLESCDTGAGVRRERYETFVVELTKCFTDGDPAGAEPLRELGLADSCTGLQRSCQDALAQRGGDASGRATTLLQRSGLPGTFFPAVAACVLAQGSRSLRLRRPRRRPRLSRRCERPLLRFARPISLTCTGPFDIMNPKCGRTAGHAENYDCIGSS